MRYILTLLAAFAVAASNAEIKIGEDLDQETRCGASIEADSGSLTVPNSGQTIAPGSICIFTIHLQTTNTFRLNISSLDISGGERDEDCSEAAVRIYALTNLVPADRRESYTFCNDSPPPPGGSFYLSGNLATVIYQASQNASQNGGFTLNFEGIAFQPIPIRHESSYSSATSGLIRYPVVGEYEPNRVNTWLVKTGDANSNLELDVIIERVDIEECGNGSGNNTCLCDALIVYEITNTGILEERARLCGSTEESLLLERLGPNFIIAFFTDYIQVPGQGSGFQILYAPYNSLTTTQPPSTTTDRPPPSNYSSTCGGVLEGIEGFIEYKLNETYVNYERCLWTIRTPFRSNMQFDLLEAGYEHLHDNIQIWSIDANGVNSSILFTNSQSSYFAYSSSTVAFVFFQSDGANTGTGFKLRFRVGYDYDNSHVYHEDQSIVVENRTVARLPESGLIRNKELSTLSVIGQNPYSGLDWSMNVNITTVNLEVDADGNCVDRLHLYQIVQRPIFNHLKRYTPYIGICRLSELPSETITGIGLFAILTSGTNTSSKAGLALEAWQD